MSPSHSHSSSSNLGDDTAAFHDQANFSGDIGRARAPLDEAICLLEKEQSVTDALLSQVREKLEPVLTPVPPSPEGKPNVGACRPVRAPAVEAVHNNLEAQERLNNGLRDLIARLAV